MAGLDATQLAVAGTGHIYVANATAAVPATATAAMSTAVYTDIGYTDESGVTWSTAYTTQDIKGWQSSDVLRILRTDRTQTLKFTLMQFTPFNVALAFPGSTVSTTSVAQGSITAADNRQVVVDGFDGTNVWRYIFPSCQIQGSLDVSLTRDAVMPLPIELRVVTGASAVTVLSNATSWA